MLSLLLITALAVQYPPASKPATDSSAHKRTTSSTSRSTQAASRDTSRAAAVNRMAFHDRMRDLWADHIVYTRGVIVSVAGNLPDTAEVTQRLLRNQDEIGEAIKPYYGDAAGTQLASLLRNHIQLAAKALTAAKGSNTASTSGAQDSSATFLSNRSGDTTNIRKMPGDTANMRTNSQYPSATGRMNDTTKATARKPVTTDTTKMRQQGNSRVTGDTVSQRLPSQQYGTVAQAPAYGQAPQVDSTALNQAIAQLKANGDSIALFLNKANPRGFAAETMKSAIQMHLTLLLQEVTAHLKKDWSGSVAAFDESLHQAAQMADMLSDGIMKQFPSRFTSKATNVSLR